MKDSAPHTSTGTRFPSEMRRRFDQHDWAGTALGPRATWPAALKAMVNTMLSSPVPMFIVCKEGSVHLYNDAFISTIGKLHPGAFGQPFDKVWGQAWRGSVEMVERALTGEASYYEDAALQLGQDDSRAPTYLTFCFSRIADENNAATGVWCVLRNTTENVVTRGVELAQVNALREAIQLAPGFIAIFSGPAHVNEVCNEAYLDLTGRRDVVNKPLAVALPETVDQGFIAVLDDVFATGTPVVGKAVRYEGRKQGLPHEYFVDYVFQPLHGTSGEISGIFLQGNDVTESVLAHHALLSSEQELRQLANTIPQLAWIANADGWVHWYNERWYEYTGTTPEQMVGWGWTVVHDPEALPRMMGEWKESLATGVPFETTFPLRAKDGTFRTFFTRAAPLIDKTGHITKWFGTNTDVTELDSAKRALEDANRRKDEFLAMLAHELRNPLAPVATAAQLLALDATDTVRVRRASEIIGRQVKHMTRLIDDLLDVSRVTRGLVTLKPTDLNIRDIVLSAIEQVQPLLSGRHHHFELDMPDSEIVVRVDKARLVQVVSNLLNNAAKYTEPHGHIALSVSASRALVTISVKDDGIGISPDLMPRLFDLFTQGERSSDRSQGGLGLGLALAKALVEISGGKIRVTSEGAHRGSVFEVVLPRVESMTPGSPGSRRTPPEFKRADTLTILIVDDNHDAAETLSIFLKAIGHVVHVACNGREALREAQDVGFDIIFLDIGLPDIDGYALARRLRLLPKTTAAKLIAVTGYGQPEDRLKSEQAGIDRHLVKPVSLDDVFGVLPA